MRNILTKFIKDTSRRSRNMKLGAVLLVGVLAGLLLSAQVVPVEPTPKHALVGNIHPDGTIGGGVGFTSTHVSPGQYQINFPAGTWNGTTLPIVVATPFVAAAPVNLRIVGYNAGSNGSLVVVFDNAGVDVNFFFIINQS